ncbi:MAG: hypothetical protein ACRELB_15210 [Polyangiaceae bacterium]
MDKARNDLSAAVPKFSLALEEHRRTPDGRVRTSQELLTTFFPHDEKACTDKMFRYLPNEVRGPIIAAWGIRGIKAALRDNDERIQQVVHDALVAGDVDHQAFEDGLAPETLVRWLPLGDLWSFWRGGKLTKQAIHKALSTAYELYLFDARWFLDTITAKGGALKGTDVLSDGLTKDELTQWIHRIHETGDGTPKGLVAALGWDKIVAKTPNDVLVAVLDAMVQKVGLVVTQAQPPAAKPAEAPHKPEAKQEPTTPVPSSTAAAPAPAAEAAKLSPLHETDKPPPADDGSWSAVPPPPDASAASGDDGINVVIEDEVIISDRLGPPTAPRIKAAAPTGHVDEEDTEVKQNPRRSERPQARNPQSRR